MFVFRSVLCFGLLIVPIAIFSDWAAADEELFPKELVTFVPFEGNPLFAGTRTDTWDRHIRERGWVMREGAKWHFWYTGYRDPTATKYLGYATSTDGIKWTRHGDSAIFDKSWVEDMHVIKQGDEYVMVAEGRADIAHMLTSTNGVDWKDHGSLDVRTTDGNPLSEGPYGTPTLWFENDGWNLFYERGDLGVWLAKSKDRKVWTNVQDDPVLKRGPDAYDRHAIALTQVLKHKDHYYAIYLANADPKWRGDWTTNIAVSDDLIHWTKYSQNPIVQGDYSSSMLVHDGKQFRLYSAHPDLRVYFPPDAEKTVLD